MAALFWWLVCIAVWGLLLMGCRDPRNEADLDWFMVYPHLRPSKKARGRAQQRRR